MKTINGLFLMFILMERRTDGRKEYTAKDKIFSKKTREGLTEEKLRHNSVSLDELYSILIRIIRLILRGIRCLSVMW